ncbi:hypothetical protein MKW94_018018 [Papaver nudicaule]|uniref:Uncharacterized protein n=1 Tax=Papaver nudicaule TaxID=74823 RepID=A0AA41RZ81_PAPNU|nr:hypothetical protein [Papaver nudicaule]
MLGNWRENSNSWSMIDAYNNTSMCASSEVASGLSYNNALIEEDGTFNPASEDDIMEIKDLLAEPESVTISMDALLYYNNECLEKCLGIGDCSGSAHQDNHLKSDTGTIQSDIPLYHNDIANANGVKEEDLHVTGDLSSADTKYTARFPKLEYTYEGLRSVILSLDTSFSGLNERVIDNSEALVLSAGTINPVPESTSDQNVLLLDKLTTHELHQAFSSIFGFETTIKDRMWLSSRILLGLQNFIEMEDGPGFLEREISSTEREDMHLKCSNNSSLESCSPGLSERVIDGAEALDLSPSTMNPVPESTSDQNVLTFDNMTTHELHQAFRSTFGLETTVEDRKWLISRISLGMQKFAEAEKGSGFLESGVSSMKHEDMHIRCNNDSHGANSSSESCSSGLNERVTESAETLDSSAGIIPVSESTSDQNVLLLDKLTTHELHQAFRIIFGLETTAKDRKWLISYISPCLRNFIETENGPGFLEREVSSTEREDMRLRCSNDSNGTNSSFESCSPGLGERVTDGTEALGLSAGTTNQVPESTSRQNVLLFDNMTTHELHQAFRSTFGLETAVKDRKWLINRISLGMQKFIELEDDSGFLESGVSSSKHEDMLLRCNNDSQGTTSSSESCSSGLSERETNGAKTLDLSAGTIPVSESTPDQNGDLLGKLTTEELHYAFRCTFGRETSVKDRKWLTNRFLNGLQNIVETENVSDLLEREISSAKHVDMHLRCSNEFLETSSSFASVGGNGAKPVYMTQTERITSLDIYKTSYSKVNQTGFELVNWRNSEAVKKRKRSWNPTRRCIEASDLKLKYSTEKLENRITSSKKNTFVLVHEDDLGDNRNDKSLSGPEHCSDLESSHSEWQGDMSESDDCISTVRARKDLTKKDLRRRKIHKVWTLSEVMQLIEGVSQHGVGRWSDIKRLLFPSSDHRTAVDLKDKWRNLLRASGALLKSKRKVYMEQKGSQLIIPESALQRVRELAIIYPYPRLYKLRHTPELHTGRVLLDIHKEVNEYIGRC